MSTEHATTHAKVRPGLSTQPRLPGRWLVLARAGWGAMAALILAVFVAGASGRFDQLLVFAAEYRRALLELGLSVRFYAVYLTALDFVIVFTHFAVAGVIFWRKSEDRMALFVSLALVTAPLAAIGALKNVPFVWRWPVDFVNHLGLYCSVGLVYLFPDGRFVPRWTRPLLVIWGVLNLPPVVLPDTPFSFTTWPPALRALLLVSWSVTGLYAQVYRYLRVSTRVQREQAKWSVLVLAVAAMGPIWHIAPLVTLPSLSRPSLPNLFYQLAGPTIFQFFLLSQLVGFTVFTVVLVLLPLSLAVAILRYRLWDIDVLINRTLVYSVMTGVLGLVFVVSVILLQRLFRPLAGQGQNEIVTVLSTLAIAALFSPLRRRVQAAIDRRFYRRKYDADQTLATFSGTLRDEVDTTRLRERVLAVAAEAMQPAHVSLWMRKGIGGPGGAAFELQGRLPQALETAPDIPPNDPIITVIRKAPGAVRLETLDLDSPGLLGWQMAGVKLAVPLICQGELIGVLNLGPRLSEQDYSSDDSRFLNHLAGQAAPALHITRLARVEQELRVARDIQLMLLPDQVPALAGWKMATYYQPARAVGGDFYDFLYLPDGRLGLAVGDVADKGVPAALLMATTCSILRATGQQFTSAGQVLERVNDLLYPDMLPKMFVTCLFAVLDPASGRLRFANAGHDLPYRRGSYGVEELRATGVPLGLMPGMKYEEIEVTLAPGESVLFYSDGLVEAHSPQREMFGFRRVREVMARHPQHGGGPMIDLLLARLEEHVGADWEQEDDVTLVTLERSKEGLDE